MRGGLRSRRAGAADEDGVFGLDTFQGTPELVEMLPAELNANTKSKHG